MKKVLIVSAMAVLVLVVSVKIWKQRSISDWDGTSLDSQVPHLLSEYDLSVYSGSARQIHNEVLKKYSVPVVVEGDDYFLEPSSYAIIRSNEEREAYAYAYYSDPEKREERIEQIHGEYVVFDVHLSLDSKDPSYIEEFDDIYFFDGSSVIDKDITIFQETSQGDIITPYHITGWPGKTRNDGINHVGVVIYFPEYKREEHYVTKETEWIRVWLKKGGATAYFHFDFQPLE